MNKLFIHTLFVFSIFLMQGCTQILEPISLKGMTEKILLDKNNTKPLLKDIARKHIPNQIIDREKQGFRAPIGEWIKKDIDLFYDLVKTFNAETNLFNSQQLNKVLNGNDFQKKWYLINLSKWHTSRNSN